jgi:hypothetical protein
MSDTPQEARPYGDWEQRLIAAFAAACEPLSKEAGASLDPDSVRFFPERTWGGRTYVPIVGEAADVSGLPEYFGYVHFDRGTDGEPGDPEADADFTDVTSDDNPDWQVDLNDSVIGNWRADGDRGGEVTLIWGSPLVRGAVAATAEAGAEVLDQAAINDGRFSLIAVDAIHGFGDELYLEIKLWDRRLNELATESLYEAEGADEGEGRDSGEDESTALQG